MTKPSREDYLLYFVTDSRLNRGYSVLEQVELALRGGVRIIQVREKSLSSSDYIRLASEALKLTRPCGAFLVINDSAEVLAEVGAEGLHLGQEDVSVEEARRAVGNDVFIGVSVKTVEEALLAEACGADYVAVNGVFPTATKDDLGYLPGLEGVESIRTCTRLPVIGIGGINRENCRTVIDAGADGVAVVTAITMSDNIPETCRCFLDQLKGLAPVPARGSPPRPDPQAGTPAV
jgi:thiamine-phosphate pyrophosphorylase